MKFDADGKRITAPAPVMQRDPAYWFEQQEINERGYCDESFFCESSPSITHLCSRPDGHPGRCAAMHKGEADGRKIRRLELA